MPTYEYQCTRCDRVFEIFHSISAKPKRTVSTDCEKCNNKAPVRRLIGTGAGVLFKGSGFYETDYRSEGYKNAAKKEKDTVEGKDKGKDGKKSDSAKPSVSKKKATDKSPD